MGMTLYLALQDSGDRADLERSARAEGAGEVRSVTSAEELAGCLESDPPALLLLSPGFPGASELLSASNPRRLQIVLALPDATEVPPEFSGQCADEELLPLRPHDLARMLRRAIRRAARIAEARQQKEIVHQPNRSFEIGRTPAAKRLAGQIERVAGAGETTVLLSGPRGVSKESVAHAIHDRSRRADQPFLCVRCVRPEEEVLGALFGDDFVPGGCLTAPTGGTLFLDEVGALSSKLQERLTKTLESRAASPIHEAPRLIAGSAQALETEVEAKRFREGLLYRLNVLSLTLPPLGATREDVLPLARAHLDALGRNGRRPPTISQQAAVVLEQHDWPGNHRELCAVLDRAALQARSGEILPHHLWLGTQKAEVAEGPLRLPLGDRTLRSVEELLIRRVLEEEQGNRSRVSRILGINRTTLYNKLKLYGIE